MARLRIVMKAGIESELPFHFSLSNMSLEWESNSQNTGDSLLHFFFQLALEVELQRAVSSILVLQKFKQGPQPTSHLQTSSTPY